MSTPYLVSISNYEGPLDLLVELVKERRMDIFSINLVELANVYVSWIEQMKQEDLDLSAEYLSLAVTLIQIKARYLLNPPQEVVTVMPEEAALLAQLTTYYQFKTLAQTLRQFETERMLLHFKSPADYAPYQLPVDESRLDGHSDLISLIISLRQLFERTAALHRGESTIQSLNLSPAQRRDELIALLKSGVPATFARFFDVPTLEHYVVTFITILDMARKGELHLSQTEQFGPINIGRGKVQEDEYEF